MKALVAYASKNGSTAEIAQAIAGELRSHGFEVDCHEAGEVRDLKPYDAVVLGSAVYMKRWRPSARRFLRRHRSALPGLPWWVFNSGPVGKPSDDPKAAEWAEPPKMMAKVEALGAREHVVFGGRVPIEPKTFVERAMVKNTPKEYADRRDWEEIRRWAAGIVSQFGQPGDASSAAWPTWVPDRPHSRPIPPTSTARPTWFARRSNPEIHRPRMRARRCSCLSTARAATALASPCL